MNTNDYVNKLINLGKQQNSVNIGNDTPNDTVHHRYSFMLFFTPTYRNNVNTDTGWFN